MSWQFMYPTSIGPCWPGVAVRLAAAEIGGFINIKAEGSKRIGQLENCALRCPIGKLKLYVAYE